MKLKSRDVSTVIIINKSDAATKTLQVKTKHISRLKYYALGLFSIISLLILTIFIQQKQSAQHELERQQLLSQISNLKGQIPETVKKTEEDHEAQSYVQAIEGKLKKINDYLRKRGLKSFTAPAMGGNGNADTALSDKEVYMAYDSYLNSVVNAVAFTPMGYPRISAFTSRFGYRSDPFSSGRAEYHPGIDFKGNYGDGVKCTANGRVVAAGWAGGYGNCVRVKHNNGYETLYGHLSRITVKVGQKVSVGDKVGQVGSTGRSTGAHLHYEVRLNGKPVNPTRFLTLNN
ncbi:M23 family metallopeptidase [Mucilaginibacter auburnensis]|uniref:Murein DD-endopeptidase MepM/ murein hydrolase activator NlpD n=1 Tax=Mucilaginibacter auburnensis TaxID=1457233 RepID=A0A2H9VR25_9SPHI|nr:M23 family metallopeptidase [Mucilaginibacter auburnensis]PJJ83264.1 murein DD-endopeptidase MepM/ murein hydrolase activator NlpD [Mucilaginibacter auburnensis]